MGEKRSEWPISKQALIMSLARCPFSFRSLEARETTATLRLYYDPFPSSKFKKTVSGKKIAASYLNTNITF